MKIITSELIKSLLKERLPDSHKGTYGHALLVAGNQGKMGAAIIAAKACIRSGVGLVTVNVPFTERSILQISLPEAMVNFRETIINDYENFSAIGIGPGIGKDALERKLLKDIIKHAVNPMVFDADALNILGDHKKMLNKLPAHSILTPHPKEFDRFFGSHSSTEERQNKSMRMAHKLNIIIVLKGFQTFVTNGSQFFLNTIGNSGLSKGGSGDALTGLITGLLAQQYCPLNAAITGVYLHSLAADITLHQQSMETMIITDIIKNIGDAFKQIEAI